MRGERDHRHPCGGGILTDQIGMVAVGAEDQRAAVAGDLTLAIQVVLERGVFDGADVIGGDVEECARVKGQSIDPLHLVRLGGHLHHQILHAVIDGFAHHAESIHRFGGGQIGFHVRAAVQAIVHRGEQCRLAVAIGAQHGLHEVGGGGLALGAGDADDRERILRTVIEFGGQQAHGLARVVDDQTGGAGRGGILGFGHVCGESGGVDAVQIFGLEPALAAQERAGLHLARVIGDGGERHVGAGDVRRIIGPQIPLNDLTQQMVLPQQRGGRSQSQSHNTSPYS